MDVAIEPVTHRLRTPLRTAYGEVADRGAFVLTLTARDGVAGRGEAAPLEAYDGVSLAIVSEALQRYAAVLADGDGRTGPELLDRCRRVADLPQALAAVDLALWDMAGRRAGRPVAELLTDGPLRDVPVNATIGAGEPAQAAEEAAAAADAGFSCVKVKVGIGDDDARLEAVRRAVGPHVALRVDANGAWDVEEAVASIERLARHDLELVEEPVSGVERLRAVRERVAARIAMDETAARHGAIASGAADAVCLKIGRAGGIGTLVAQAALVRALGAEVYVASTLDGPLGIAAAVHCAAALRVELPCGLATLPAIGAEHPALPVRAGHIRVPTGPGLGIDP
ncbi:o-succinylbenzoate synthase [Baekduia soli]|uniref:O-succinylbenzoate synthase n=1 Tax=Baekduia soli TaxID=496014 RepID=A0A5B8U7E8_9ACTN|nr:mandelate racemase/muconate lactonizing enzyme family protein [Baekduia soli]QEC48867.1 o-succinylbenzoate synthase [Baekduia soli]